jgi:hypothetical protein
MKKIVLTSLLFVGLSLPAMAQTSMTGGTGGSAAVGGTSASTVGTGGTSTGPSGTGSSIAGGGSAAGGKTMSNTSGNNGNGPVLNNNTKAQAHDGGTFSKSHTRTQVKAGEEVGSTTKTMSHEPGSKPVKSTTTTNVR